MQEVERQHCTGSLHRKPRTTEMTAVGSEKTADQSSKETKAGKLMLRCQAQRSEAAQDLSPAPTQRL